MLMSLRLLNVCWVVSVALLACACGSDDKKAEPTPADDENDGGAAALAPSYPPALGPEDCVASTSKITLTQPEGAAVWGGLVLLEFEVEGAKVDSFDVQVFDPGVAAWMPYYVNLAASGQREDGSYFIAASPYFNEGNKDQELKMRVRPTQSGCPDADWTETAGFSATDPLVGTQWKAQISAGDFNGRFDLLRNPLEGQSSSDRLMLGDATLSLDFGKKGILTEALSVPLSTKKDEPYDGCTLNLTFTGSYELGLRPQYGGLKLSVSEQRLISFEGSTCKLPAVEEIAFSAEDFDVRLSAYTQQGLSIDYLPLLYVSPGAPVWRNSQLSQIFQQLPEFLTYLTADESGSVSGYMNVNDLELQRQ